jgi:mannose-6-phosphate isomerase-like protein (cupin superfamily)
MKKSVSAAIAALSCAMVTTASLAQTAAMCTGLSDAASWAAHREAVTAAPKNHKVIYETADLRVLEVTVLPGEREASHHHRWPSVMVVDSRPPYTNYDKDGKVFQSVVQGQQTVELPLMVRLPPQAEHAIENAGNKPFHAIRIEYKRLCEQ